MLFARISFMRSWAWLFCVALVLALFWIALDPRVRTIRIDTSASGRQQTIDGFGTCLSGTEGQFSWWQDLYFGDLKASILRFDIVPRFKSPYSDFAYNSPWFHNHPALPGPDNNNVRTYASAADYTRQWAGRSAPVAVMGPNIDKNIEYFDYDDEGLKTAGRVARVGVKKKLALGDFKLLASMWSPAPWLKRSSRNFIRGQSGVMPTNGTPWPFIWAGNFSGGVFDASGTPRSEFNDAWLGGSGPTSALTQMARALAAYLRGFQQKYGVTLYAVSIQNELNFETFYNSCSYPLSSDYIAALKTARAELDKYDDLKSIRLIGPEDLLGGDGYGMWQYGSGSSAIHKNLQYLQHIAADRAAAIATDFFCIHGYAADGVNASGSDPKQWDWWVNGWTSSPGPRLPATVKGFSSYGKKSWMTETSGEDTAWLAPSSGFPGQGAFSIAVKIHQALTTGRESAWVYWQMTDGKPVQAETLTDGAAQERSAKYSAAKHFFRYIRPGAVRVNVSVTGADALLSSAYVHDANGTLTVVLVNTQPSAVTATLDVPANPIGIASFDAYTSSDASYFKQSTIAVSGKSIAVTTPGYGVVTLYGSGKGTRVATDAGITPDGPNGADASRGEVVVTRRPDRREARPRGDAKNALLP